MGDQLFMGRKKETRTTRKTRSGRVTTENRVAMLTITIIVCVLFAVLLVNGTHLKSQMAANEETKEALNQDISDEEARTDSINSLKEYYSSDDFIRQAAKDKLGMVEDGEIIFKSES